MKNILIIYPHWPPSNLAGVHRARLIGNFLTNFGWNTTVLTVHEEYYEEKLDPEICKTVSDSIRVVKCKAFPVYKPRIIGDIGLRGAYFLYKKALLLIKQNDFDFIWIPIPSFYTSIIGRLLFDKTNIPYGIDYIDPWVRDIHNRKNLRSIISLKLAKILEPIAVKKASLISGVSFEYYKPVLERNFGGYFESKNKGEIYLNPTTQLPFTDVAMPYGFDPNDHEIKLEKVIYPWSKDDVNFVYAGAYLPNSKLFIEEFMKCLYDLNQKNELPANYRFYFLGTGNYTGTTIEDLSRKYHVEKFVVEKRKRFTYLEILNFLSSADGILIFGSTEKHYTASKTFQALMSGKKIFSVFHQESSAVECLNLCEADEYTIKFDTNNDWKNQMNLILKKFLFDNNVWTPNLLKLKENYSSLNSAKKLTYAIDYLRV